MKTLRFNKEGKPYVKVKENEVLWLENLKPQATNGKLEDIVKRSSGVSPSTIAIDYKQVLNSEKMDMVITYIDFDMKTIELNQITFGELLQALMAFNNCKVYIYNLKALDYAFSSWFKTNGYKYDVKLSSLKTIKVLEMKDTNGNHMIYNMKVKNKVRNSIEFLCIRNLTLIKDEALIDKMFPKAINGMAHLTKLMLDNNFDKLTLGSNAFEFWHNEFFAKREDYMEFNKYFGKLTNEQDTFCRKASYGGWNYINPKYAKTYDRVLPIRSFDINSMYPSIMYNEDLPIGTPTYFKGEVPKDKLWIGKVKTKGVFSVKEGCFPSIHLSMIEDLASFDYQYMIEDVDLNSYIDFNYVGEELTLHLTNIDYKLILDTYDIELEVIEGYSFEVAPKNIFKDYIDYWMTIKEKATIDKNEGLRQLAKMFLNNLYGKFGTNNKTKKTFRNDEGTMLENPFEVMNNSKTKTYVPITIFITSHGRNRLVREAIANNETYAYGDSDSLKLVLKENEKANLNFPIDSTKLGCWKDEGYYEDSLFLKQKTYMVKENGQWKATLVGLPKHLHPTFNNKNELYIGKEFESQKIIKSTLKTSTFSII